MSNGGKGSWPLAECEQYVDLPNLRLCGNIPITENRMRENAQPMALTVYGREIIPEPTIVLMTVIAVSNKSIHS